MSKGTVQDTQSPALHLADGDDLIRVHGARVNNLNDVSIEIPRRQLSDNGHYVNLRFDNLRSRISRASDLDEALGER